MGRIPEAGIYTAFLRMYRKMRCNADTIFTPAMEQLQTLQTALRQKNPQMLTINREIAEATEARHKISLLRTSGLLDADACAVRMNLITAKLTQLRGERRKLAENEALDETIDMLRNTESVIRNGPEQLNTFDETLFNELVEKIVAESQTRIRFCLRGGLELAERIEVTRS